jgi:hypothetical protein
MDNVTLRKKLSTYSSDKGYLKNVSEELLYEVLLAWENWTGASKEFYSSLGFSSKQMASIIGKAKKLKREGHFGESEFKQIKVTPDAVQSSFTDSNGTPCGVAEIVWTGGQVIRFAQVDSLVDFLKKVA